MQVPTGGLAWSETYFAYINRGNVSPAQDGLEKFLALNGLLTHALISS
jgi:hypothetical protein